ncbi:MAG: hypothetical protein ACK559_15765 [bacterium]
MSTSARADPDAPRRAGPCVLCERFTHPPANRGARIRLDHARARLHGRTR